MGNLAVIGSQTSDVFKNSFAVIMETVTDSLEFALGMNKQMPAVRWQIGVRFCLQFHHIH